MVVRPYFNLTEMEYDGKLDYLFLSKNNNDLQNIYYLDRKIVNEKPDFRIKKGVLENNIFTISDFSKLELNANEVSFKLIPRNNNSFLFMKYNPDKKTVKIDILKQL
ncbi:hypothetical protein [Flavobacterium sp.]|uniref:hypothetical protein n=1 Tax=Flavobacterium sp. TaxID=239 RepID=UPI00286D7080|nr:hypothetical protein [Flavobacterium sp.]